MTVAVAEGLAVRAVRVDEAWEGRVNASGARELERSSKGTKPLLADAVTLADPRASTCAASSSAHRRGIDVIASRGRVTWPRRARGSALRIAQRLRRCGTEVLASRTWGLDVGAAAAWPYAACVPKHPAEEVHVGNFVEVKASRIARIKANHLTYIGI